jgi:hypothetical protein
MGPSYRNESRLQVAFVLATWAFLALAVVLYIARYAHNVPYYDDWVIMVDALSGAQPVDAAWLWQAHNDHRIPIPKLVLLALYHLGGWDFRVGMFAKRCWRGWPGQGSVLQRTGGEGGAMRMHFFP